MARFYGKVGFGETVAVAPGSDVYQDVVTEYSYFGDVLRNTRRSQEGQYLNNDLSVNNSISIVADAYARENFHKIRCVEFNSIWWTVPTVEVAHPRLILSLGEVYNGPTPVPAEDDS